MDIHKTGVLCTKRKLWKKQNTITQVVDYMLQEGYQFIELVYGEPNNFVFADEYNEIKDVLKKKGFFGIRIKFKNNSSQIEIHSNTNGIDNVKYDVFTETEMSFKQIEETLEQIKNIIGSSNDTLIKGEEFFQKRRQLRLAIMIVLGVITLYFLNVHILIFNFVYLVVTSIPLFFVFYFIYLFMRRR